MQRRHPAVWTVHIAGQCIPARAVIVEVPLTTVFKGHDAAQPRAYMSGYAHVHREGETVYLT